MMVTELDVFSAPLLPAKTHPPLGVDAYAVQSLPITFQRLQAIAGRAAQVREIKRPVDHRRLRRAAFATSAGVPLGQKPAKIAAVRLSAKL
jgi:hypothetical protein